MSRLLPIIICADDFGLNVPVNRAVLELLHAGRLSAASCLVDGAAIHAGASELRHLQRSTFDLGLHLNFTEALEGGLFREPLPFLIARAYGGRLDLTAIRMEVRRQLTRFEDVFGAAPDYVDGHQHVHQLPGVRQILLSELHERYGDARPWLRSCRRPTQSWSIKSLLIDFLGANGLVRAATQNGFRTNGRLLGVYDFSGSVQEYLERTETWLRQAQPFDLLMCHPGLGNDDRDQISSARWAEYAALSSDAFERALVQWGAVPSRLPRTNALMV